MTIGIAAYGPNAGLAVIKALSAAEAVGWGSIGGFASFAAITADGSLQRYQTQRGGSKTLFVDGDLTGVEPPSDIIQAPLAAVMSSGPDRAEPLSQFVPGDATLGLVSGHRLPNTPGANGQPLNLAVLQHLRQGHTPQQAVDQVLAANPQADAGFIAVNLAGQIYACNSQRVRQRPDIGAARRQHAASGAVVEVLHNAIQPAASLAAVVADIALETMVPRFHPNHWLLANAGIQVRPGDRNIVYVDDELLALEIITSNTSLLGEKGQGAAIYIESEVRQGERLLGNTVTEPYVLLEKGRIISLNGQSSLRIGFRTTTR